MNFVIIQFDSPVIDGGSKLNSVGSWELRQLSLSFFTRVLHPSQPQCSALYVLLPMFGTSPSIFFHTYIIIYRSRLLSIKNRQNSFNFSQ